MIEQILRVLVEAGADPIAAVRAAEVLDRGGSVDEAWQAMLAPAPARVDLGAELLVAAASRSRERVEEVPR